MTLPVVEYLDYRKYIMDYYIERKSSIGFTTWRAFAQKAIFSSPVYLKQVADGKCNLSSAAAERVAKAMPGADFVKIAKKCYPKITSTEVKVTVQMLLRMGLLVQDKNGLLCHGRPEQPALG